MSATALKDIWVAPANGTNEGWDSPAMGPWPITAPEVQADGKPGCEGHGGGAPVTAEGTGNGAPASAEEGYGGAPAMKCETYGI